MADEPKSSAAEKAEESSESSAGSNKTVDVSDISAPSIGPNTVIKYESPQERLARGDQSDTDAMGLDKRREVVGGRYSASALRQVTVYGLVVAVIIGAGFGFKLLADELDQPPKTVVDEAPWAEPGTPQRAPDPLQ